MHYTYASMPPKKPRSKKAPARAAQGAESLAELERRGLGFFRELLPLGPDGLRLIRAAEAAVPTTDGDRGGFRALDVLLRLSEAIGVNASYAKILRGAATVFAERGYEAATMEDLLGAAEVSVRTFYQYFRNKSEVLEALYTLLTNVWSEVLVQAVQQEPTPEAKLQRLVHGYLGGFAVAGDLVNIIMTEAVRPGSSLGTRYLALGESMMALLTPIYEERCGGAVDPIWVRTRVTAMTAIALDLRLSSRSEEALLNKVGTYMLDILMATPAPA